MRGSAGFSTTELLITLTIAAMVAAMAVPAAGRVLETNRGRQAAAFVAGRLRSAQQSAALANRVVGVVFDPAGDDWTFRICEDGNRNGLRRGRISAAQRPPKVSNSSACGGSGSVVSIRSNRYRSDACSLVSVCRISSTSPSATVVSMRKAAIGSTAVACRVVAVAT